MWVLLLCFCIWIAVGRHYRQWFFGMCIECKRERKCSTCGRESDHGLRALEQSKSYTSIYIHVCNVLHVACTKKMNACQWLVFRHETSFIDNGRSPWHLLMVMKVLTWSNYKVHLLSFRASTLWMWLLVGSVNSLHVEGHVNGQLHSTCRGHISGLTQAHEYVGENPSIIRQFITNTRVKSHLEQLTMFTTVTAWSMILCIHALYHFEDTP